MRITRKGVLPDNHPDWWKCFDTLRTYLSDLELCLDTANKRLRALAIENELLRRNANCPYSWLALPTPPDNAEKEAADE